MNLNLPLSHPNICLSFFVSIFLLSCTGINTTQDMHTVITSTGIAQGGIKDEVISWEDIPYALPPIGDLRWRAPRSYQDQTAALSAKDVNGCLQEPSIYG